MVNLSDQAVLNAFLRDDLGTFVAKVFQTVSPGDKYCHNWHIDAIVHQLMEVHIGANRRLIITQPPRSLKSICTSVAFVAWTLGHDPSQRFACVSYSSELAAVLARQFRNVVTSDWYRTLFPAMCLTKDTESECVTTKGGGRFAVSVGGSFTGRGADVIIIDDPLKADDAQSESARRTVNDWYGSTLLSRLDDKKTGSILLVMQRLHEDDLAGKLLREGGWHHLDLPAISLENEEIPIGPNASHCRKQGEALHPERESLTTLDKLKREIGSLVFSAQYQQRPIPLEGNLIRRDWIKWYNQAPDNTTGIQIVQSWDIATTTGPNNDWSVCTTWLVHKQDYHLIAVWRGRLEFPQLRRKLIELARSHNPNSLLIEQAGPGLHLIQELRANPIKGVVSPIGINPDGDKVTRMAAQAVRFEAGQVLLPENAPWLAEFLRELLGFPSTKHDDQVDSVSQFLRWITQNESRSKIAMIPPEIIYSEI